MSVFAFLTFFMNAQYVQKEFMIGVNIPPFLVQESATAAPADYNGDGRSDLGSRINTGLNKGHFQIDYSSASPWFQKQGWPYKTSSAIYGTAQDFLVCADYDGDKKADISVYFPGTKIWRIDYAKNGFGKWDVSYDYGFDAAIDGSAIPLPANYDGDNKIDIGFKTNGGKWLFDFAADGLGKIDVIKAGYGNSTEHPVPADYDGDGVVDLSVKNDSGFWKIDYYINGYGGWDATVAGCGDQTEIPVPADYDGDGKADLSVKTNTGIWKVAVKFRAGSSIIWLPETLRPVYGGAEAAPFPADFNGDGRADFSFVFTPDGRWLIDDFYARTNGYDWMSNLGKTANDYNVNEINPRDIANYTKLKNCNFNLIIDGMNFLQSDYQRNYYLALIDMVGLNTMLTHPHIFSYSNPNDDLAFDKKAFVNHYKNFVSAKKRNRIYAINLGDEPSDQPMNSTTKAIPLEIVKDWTIFFSRQYPGLPTFNNLLPSYAYKTEAEYLRYLDQYKKSSNSPFICFDQYPFSHPALFTYFYNLRIIKTNFEDRAMWSTIWSAKSSINDIDEPNETQFQFMAFCPIAYGAKGLVYFPYDKSFNPNFRSALNDDSIKYNHAKNINLFLKNIVGPVTVGCKIIATLHKNNTYLNRGHPFTDAELIVNYKGLVKDVSNDNILIGIFEKNKSVSTERILKGARHFIWVVNKDTTEIRNLSVTFRGNYINKLKVSPRALNYVKNPSLFFSVPAVLNYHAKSNTTDFIIPALGGGEGIMIKLL